MSKIYSFVIIFLLCVHFGFSQATDTTLGVPIAVDSVAQVTADSATIETGQASYYSDKFIGRRTASGQKYSAAKLTAAHKTLPLGTKVRVTNLSNGKSVIVTINDRGSLRKGRVIDLSKKAAQDIGMMKAGVAKVKLERI